MKRYLAFYFDMRYANGGMNDFFNDFDSFNEAFNAIIKHHTSIFLVDTTDTSHFQVGEIYDSATNENKEVKLRIELEL